MPTVFISYRQLDDIQCQRVREFAEKIKARGIEVILDQFHKDQHPGGPPEGWPKWSSDQAGSVRRVLIIGTAAWFRCYEGKEAPGTGVGAACEAGVLRQRIYDLGGEQDIIRIALFDAADVSTIALDLKRYDRFQIERDFEHLIAWIKGEPLEVNTSAEPTPRHLRFWSTRESIERGEITVLAIIETLLAVALLITLSVWLDTVKWLAGACVVAPLLLMKTEESDRFGIQTFGIVDKLITARGDLIAAVVFAMGALILSAIVFHLVGWWLVGVWFVFGGAILLSSMLFVLLGVRLCAFVTALIRYPKKSCLAISHNWRRIVLCSDIASEPEHLPGLSAGPSMIFESDTVVLGGPKYGLLDLWFRCTAFSGIYPFAMAYRWSVKATCLIYLPLVWLANKAQYSPRRSLLDMLHDYLVDDIQRVRRWLAILAVSALTVKVFVWWYFDDARAWAHEHVPAWGLKIAHEWHHYLDPQHVPWWQITPALNGLIALGMMVYARRVLNLKDHTPSDAVVLRNWRMANVVSGALSIYTIVCVLLLTWKAGDLLGTLHKLWHMLDHQVLP